MWKAAAILVLATAAGSSQETGSIQLRYLYTFGSKNGIHPNNALNRRPALAALGRGEHPYGLGFPVAVAVDRAHRVWITDSATRSVHVFHTEAHTYREIRRVGDVELRRPAGIVCDAQGRMYIADTELANVFVFDENGEYDRALVRRSDKLLERPTVVALSEDGKTVLVADPPKNSIVELNREGELNMTIQLPTELREPIAMAVIDNQVWVMGSQQHRVGIFSPGGRQRGEWRWEDVRAPSAFTFDSRRGWLFVANPRWAVVQVFDRDGRNLSVFGRLGEDVDQMRQIDSIHVDPEGHVYVVDSRRGKVLVFGEARTE